MADALEGQIEAANGAGQAITANNAAPRTRRFEQGQGRLAGSLAERVDFANPKRPVPKKSARAVDQLLETPQRARSDVDRQIRRGQYFTEHRPRFGELSLTTALLVGFEASPLNDDEIFGQEDLDPVSRRPEEIFGEEHER